VGVAFWCEADEQPWLDAMEIARAHGLPIVFVCPPLSEESTKQLASFVSKPGSELPRITTDGNDPVAVYRVAHESIERARRGRGATLIECGHFRTPGARRVDAVTAIKRYMKAKGLENRE
jgi:pyruvate dehydrogenase E1 component alpha subunit